MGFADGDEPIGNTEDVIDSREVIARISYLLAGQEDAENDSDLDPLTTDEVAELDALRALAEQAEQYADDWHHGEALIRDDYFEAYARDFAIDTGYLPDQAAWPLNCIDWEEAAKQFQSNYTSVNLAGVTYWIR